MSAPLVYNVLTEFKFEIGSALLGSEKLAGAVDQISTAADNTLLSFKKLGLGIVAQMGLAEGSILGVFSEAIKVADKFKQSQLAFSNIISSNMDHLIGPIDTFNDRMLVSEMIMKNIGKAAREFALDEGDLLSTTKMLSAQLVPKGLAGKNFGGALDMSRFLLKSAPTLGVNTQDVQGQLLRAIEGGASTGDTLFRRLSSETAPFKEIKGGSAGFNALPAAKRVEVLTKALKQFASDTDVVNGNVNTLAGQMRAFGTLVKGPISSILKPLGDVVLIPLVDTLKKFNSFLDGDGIKIVESFSKFIGPIIENPKKLLIDLLQLKRLSGDVKTGGSIFGTIGLISGLMHLGKMFPIIGESLASAGVYIAGWVGTIAAMIPWARVLGVVFSVIGFTITRLIPGMLGVTLLMQIFSRAMAIAKVADIQTLANAMPNLMVLLGRFKDAMSKVLAPILACVDAAAQFLSPIFEMGNWIKIATFVLEPLVSVLEDLGIVSVLAWAGFQGLLFGLMQFIDNLKSGNILGAFTGVADAFNAGVTDIIDKNLKGLGDQSGAIVNQVTNIGKVEIKNQFKENNEPDRIAFSLTKQLMKVAQNPTQSRGRQFAPVGGA